MPIIRKATLQDAKPLAVLAERTFRETFGPENSPEDMDVFCRRHYGEDIQAREIGAADVITFLSEDDGSLTGFAQLRWGKVPTCVMANSAGEIQRLYVASEWQGREWLRR